MTFFPFVLIAVSVVFHVGWNLLSKKTVPSIAFYALSAATCALACLPGVFFAAVDWEGLPGRFWRLCGVSVASQCWYYFGLAEAYRRGDISLVYPLTRALPVLATAGVSMFFGWGARPGNLALGGMAVVFAGCLLMPFSAWKDARVAHCRTPLIGYVLLSALGITGYTLADSEAMLLFREFGGGGIPGAVVYQFLVLCGSSVVLAGWVCVSPSEREEVRLLLGKTAAPHLSGILAGCGYVLVLTAMTMVDNVSYVQAFRQMSLPVGVIAGIVFLKEKPGAPRLAGVGLVIAGLVAVALA